MPGITERNLHVIYILAFQKHFPDRATVFVLLAGNNCRVSPEDQIGKMLFGSVPERLFQFRRVFYCSVKKVPDSLPMLLFYYRLK
jgi:hypothetical protein